MCPHGLGSCDTIRTRTSGSTGKRDLRVPIGYILTSNDRCYVPVKEASIEPAGLVESLTCDDAQLGSHGSTKRALFQKPTLGH